MTDTPETLQRTMQEKDREVAQLKEQLKGIESQLVLLPYIFLLIWICLCLIVGKELMKKVKAIEAENHHQACNSKYSALCACVSAEELVK